jgi:hypothetical protein
MTPDDQKWMSALEDRVLRSVLLERLFWALAVLWAIFDTFPVGAR